MKAKELRGIKNDLFATKDSMDEVIEFAKEMVMVPESKAVAITIVMVTFNTLLEGIANEMESDEGNLKESPLEEATAEDILLWADGVLAALGTEHRDKVSEEEINLAQTIVERNQSTAERRNEEGYCVGEKHPSTFEKITLQSIFDKAWQTFIVDGEPPAVALVTDGSAYACRYKTRAGRACAIGLSLPDSLLEKMEEDGEYGSTFGEIAIRYPEYFSNIGYNVANKLQHNLHDRMVDSFTGKWNCGIWERERVYRSVAKKLSLSIPGE